MVAVTAVFVNHVSGHPKGAFTGVDVFFVISGFLITGLLVRDAARPGKTAGSFFGGFYQRRARRILPAAILTLVVAWIAAGVTFHGSRVAQAHSDVWWSFGFLANVHYARLGTDYFAQGRAPSITQHFWSLAVEEQFYLVWPIVILVVLAVLGRRRAGSLNVLLAVISLLTVASFIYAERDTASSNATAYFSTFARAWELGVGAVLAVVLTKWPGIPARFGAARGPLMLLGVALIVVSFFVVSPGAGFPAPSGAFPVLATALVIIVGPSESAWTWVLTNRVSVAIGEISFSLYLWHWPVIIIVSALISPGSALYYTIVVTATLGLSIFSYQFIETPFRTQRSKKVDGDDSHRRVAVGSVAGLLLVVALVGYAFKPNAVQPSFADNAVIATQAPASNPNVAIPTPALSRQIVASLQATSFPSNLSPDPGQLGAAPEQRDWNGCNTATTVQASCTFKPSGTADPKKTAVVLGDSISLSWLPAVRAALVPRGWTVIGLARQQCAASFVKLKALTQSTAQGCAALHNAYSQLVQQVNPSLVIMSSVETTLRLLSDGSSGSAAASEYQNGMEKTIKLWAGHGRKIVTLSPPPAAPSTHLVTDCLSGGHAPADCVFSPTYLWTAQSTADAAAAAATKTTYVDSHLWFCSTNDFCPSFVGSTTVRYDNEHISKAYARKVGPELAAALGV